MSASLAAAASEVAGAARIRVIRAVVSEVLFMCGLSLRWSVTRVRGDRPSAIVRQLSCTHGMSEPDAAPANAGAASASELQALHRGSVSTHFLGVRRGQGDEALVSQITVSAECLVARVFLHELGDARDDSDVRLLHVEEQRPRDRIFPGRDRVERRRDTINDGALDLVLVFFEEAVAEDSHCGRTRDQLLDDHVVVLARLDVGTVFAQTVANRLEALLIHFLELFDPREGAAA